MSEKPFFYQDPFPLGPDTTGYRLLSREGVSTSTFEGREILKVAPEALTLLAAEAIKAINFTLRPAHLAQVAAFADNHQRVLKTQNGDITESDVASLSAEDREAELARMLSGLSDSVSARQHATELMSLARAGADF